MFPSYIYGYKLYFNDGNLQLYYSIFWHPNCQNNMKLFYFFLIRFGSHSYTEIKVIFIAIKCDTLCKHVNDAELKMSKYGAYPSRFQRPPGKLSMAPGGPVT